jgi:hypothetical protein
MTVTLAFAKSMLRIAAPRPAAGLTRVEGIGNPAALTC